MQRDSVLRVTRTHGEIRRFYDRLSGVYDLLAARFETPLITRALAALDARPGERLLEIGCGTGHALAALAEAVGPSGTVVGVDLSEHMLHRTAGLLERRRSPDATALVCGDAVSLPLADGWADKILMTFTLELFDTPEIPVVLGECLRILRPGGRLAVASLSRPANRWRSVQVYEWVHRRFPSFATCRPIHVEAGLARAGFAIRDVARVVAVLPIEMVLAERVATRRPPGRA